MQLDKEAATYDQKSPEKDLEYWFTQFDIDVLGLFLIGEKVIELGCGKGNVTEKLGRCQKLVVVEAAEANIAIVSNRLKERSNVEFYHSLWQDFDYAAADISDFFMGLQSLDHEEPLFVLRKTSHFLRPQGRLHVVAPNAESLHRRIAYYKILLRTFTNLVRDIRYLDAREFTIKRCYSTNERVQF
jgi:SAM-dependent methyltransferase